MLVSRVSTVRSGSMLLLFFSGLAALIYQTLWVRQLGLVVGVDVYAVTVGVAGFFAGLAIGSASLGALAEKFDRPLLLYAVLEIGIAVLGVAGTLVLAELPATFVHLRDAAGSLAFVLPIVVVAVPAILMGGTLPPLLVACHPRESVVGSTSGRLYAANTAGAIAGALFTVFWIVPQFGIRGAAGLAAGVNVLLAVSAALLSARADRVAADPARPASRMSQDAKFAVGLYALAGAIALGYEVIWTQVIVQFLSTRAIAFALVLATYLFGLTLGSALYSTIADKVSHRWGAFGMLVTAAGIAALICVALLGPWLLEAQTALGRSVFDATDSRMLQMCARFALATSVIILIPTIFLGAAFPAVSRLTVDANTPGRDVGRVLAVNTAAGIAGTMMVGFVLIPAFGLARSLGLLAVAAALIGVAAMSYGNRRLHVPALLVAIAVAAGAFTLPADRLATLLIDARGGRLVSYAETAAGTVAVVEQDASKGRFRRLYVQGVSNTGDAMPSLRYMRLQALLPLLVHRHGVESALVIGLGTGITGGALLTDPIVTRRLCVELLRPVVDAATNFNGNFGVTRDPRVEIRVADGRHELMRLDERFDLITLEPPPPAARGVANLYSTDFYGLARERLTPNGLLAQWLPLNTQNEEDSQSLVRSVLDSFPHVSLWTTEFHEMLLLASTTPQQLDYEFTAQRTRIPAIAEALTEIGVTSAATLLATYVTDTEGLRVFAATAQPVTDDNPRIEYAPWVRPNEIDRVLPKLLGLRKPPPVDGTAAQQAAIELEYRRLTDFYDIMLLARRRDRDGWARKSAEFLRTRQANAYFDWFFGR